MSEEISPLKIEIKSINPLMESKRNIQLNQIHPINFEEPEEEEFQPVIKNIIQRNKKTLTAQVIQFYQHLFQGSSLIKFKTLRIKGKYQKMIKNGQISQSKLKDEEFKRNHKLYYFYLLISFYFQYIIFPGINRILQIIFLVFILFGTIMCLTTLVLWNYYECGKLSKESYQLIIAFDIVQLIQFIIFKIVGISFILELVYNLFNNLTSFQDFINRLLDLENIIDTLLIFHIFWIVSGQPKYKYLAFFNILRSLRVTKLRYITQLVSHYLKSFVFKTDNDDIAAADIAFDFDEEGQLNTFIVDSLIKFISSIFIESTYFLAFDELADYEGFSAYSKQNKFEFLHAAYFVIVSFSTIGYGYIYPNHPLTRFACSLALIVNITVMSNFLGKMVDFLFQLSPYCTSYDFKDHVVIIGQVDDYQLKDFLDEMIQMDIAQRSLMKVSNRTKTIIVMDKEPSEFIVDMAYFYTEEYENEVTFLKEGIFTQNQKWQQQTNLKKAKILFAFSWNNEDGSSYENDQRISFVAKGVREKFSKPKIIVILNSSFKDLFISDSLYQGIEMVSPIELNDYILASSLQNPGISTILQHLVTMKAKQVPDTIEKIVEDDNFLSCYLQSMQQELYQFVIPDFFVGMSFKDYGLFLYSYGLKLDQNELESNKFIQDSKEDVRKCTLIALETKQNQQTLYTQNDYSQIGQDQQLYTNANQEDDKLSNEVKQHNKKSLQQNQILINPQDYIIKKGDIGYAICENYETVQESLQITSHDNLKYQNYLRNYQRMKDKLNNTQICMDIKDMYNQQQNQIKCNNLKQLYLQNDVFDFIDQKNLPEISLDNHIIIFGNLINFQNVSYIIRQYSNTPILLYNNQILDTFKWQDIKCKFKNVYFIRGDYLNLDHLKQIKIRNASNILILAGLSNIQFPDAIGLCLARIIMDHYDRTDFILQLKDSQKISLLNNNPKFKKMYCPTFLQPSFISGNIHFSSMITAMLAKVVHNTNWIQFFKDLTIPNKDKENDQNKTVNYLKVSKQMAEYKYYGLVQYALLQSEPSIIAIGLSKQTFQSQYKESIVEQFRSKEQLEIMRELIKSYDGDKKDKQGMYRGQIEQQMKGILSKVFGDKVVLTNPSFYTVIEEGDSLIVLGQTKQELTENERQNQRYNNYIDKFKNKKKYLCDKLSLIRMKEELIKVLKQRYLIEDQLIRNTIIQ